MRSLLFVGLCDGETEIVVNRHAFATLAWSVRGGYGAHHDSHESAISSKASLAQKGVIAMQQLAKGHKRARNHQYAESEGRMWDSEEDVLLDPKVIEPPMYSASPESEAGWGFHARAERLNGRLAMLGFVIGITLEFLRRLWKTSAIRGRMAL